MKGCEGRIERELELAMFIAWNTARLTNYSGGKLAPLGKEMERLRRPALKRKQTSEEMLSALRAIAAQTRH